MKRTSYEIKHETYEDQREAGRYNPSLEITFRDKTGVHTHKTVAGTSDDLDVYREGSLTCLLNRNFNLGYIGLEVFEGGKRVFDIFMGLHQIPDDTGDLFEAAPYNSIKYLLQWM